MPHLQAVADLVRRSTQQSKPFAFTTGANAQARLRPCWPGKVSNRRWLDVNTKFAKALFLAVGARLS